MSYSRHIIDSLTGGVSPVRTELSRQSKRAGDVLLPVNVEKFDAAWALDGDSYIPKGGEGVPGRRARFDSFYGHLQTIKGLLEAPVVSVGSNGVVSFINGRHRFSVQRDNGVDPIYVGFTKGSVGNARAHGLVNA